MTSRIEAMGLTRHEAAIRAGISPSTFYRKVSRKSAFETMTMRELADVSEVVDGFSVEELMAMGLKVRKEER